MNKLALSGLLLLAVAGAVWLSPGTGPQPAPDRTNRPPSTVVITFADPGDVAATKFAILEHAGNARESRKFAERLRQNPQTHEFAGAGPAVDAWRVIAQDVRRTSQEGLALKIMQIQDTPNGWQEAADYLEAAGAGWQRSADALTKLVD